MTVFVITESKNKYGAFMNTGYNILHKGNEILIDYWLKDILFSWQWFLVILLTVAPWMIWIKFRDKMKSKQYLVSALFIMIVSSFLDIVGLTFDFWRYPVQLFPSMVGFFPWNLSLLPVTFLFAFQIREQGSLLIKAIFVSSIAVFLGEPFFDSIGFTNHLHWRHIYSFPFYFFIFIIANYVGKSLTHPNEEYKKDIQLNKKYHDILNNSFDAIYYIEKKHNEKNFRFSEVNEAFCNEMGYTKEEIMTLDPRLISDQSNYNIDIKYRPLIQNGQMTLETVFITKAGKKRFVKVFCKAIHTIDKIEVLSIIHFEADEVSENLVN
jgi:PAS domain S-box-containing protein